MTCAAITLGALCFSESLLFRTAKVVLFRVFDLPRSFFFFMILLFVTGAGDVGGAISLRGAGGVGGAIGGAAASWTRSRR